MIAVCALLTIVPKNLSQVIDDDIVLVGGRDSKIDSAVARSLVGRSKDIVNEFPEENLVVIREDKSIVVIDIETTGIRVMRRLQKAATTILERETKGPDLKHSYGAILDPSELPELTQYTVAPMAKNEIRAVSNIFITSQIDIRLTDDAGNKGRVTSSKERLSPSELNMRPFNKDTMISKSPNLDYFGLPSTLTISLLGWPRNVGYINSKQAEGHRVFWNFFENERTRYNGVMGKFAEKITSLAYPDIDMGLLKPGASWFDPNLPPKMKDSLRNFGTHAGSGNVARNGRSRIARVDVMLFACVTLDIGTESPNAIAVQIPHFIP